MEETNYTGNLNAEYYSSNVFGDEDTTQISGGQYPIILAKDGAFTKLYVSAEELCKYNHWDALDSDREGLIETHGQNLPIVWECNPEGGMFETGLQHKEISE